MNLDNIDLNILRELSRDSRITLSEISLKVNLSIPAVSERINKLIKNKYIKSYTIILDSIKFNKRMLCFTSLSLKHGKTKPDSFIEFIESHPDIMECHLVTGEYEYILKIVTEDAESLGKILDSLRTKADVLTSSTSIGLSTLKNNVSINI